MTQAADVIALASLVVAFAALCLAFYAIYRGNRNTSAATLVAINEAFRQAWDRLLAVHAIAHTNELADLMNLLETVCAIHSEGSLAGISRELIKEYLDSVLGLLVNDAVFSPEIPKLLHEPHTFRHIKQFLNIKRTELSVTVPPAWYESYT